MKKKTLQENQNKKSAQIIFEGVTVDQLSQLASIFKSIDEILADVSLPYIEKVLDKSKEDLANIQQKTQTLVGGFLDMVGLEDLSKKEILLRRAIARILATQQDLVKVVQNFPALYQMSKSASFKESLYLVKGVLLTEVRARNLALELGMSWREFKKMAEEELGWKGNNQANFPQDLIEPIKLAAKKKAEEEKKQSNREKVGAETTKKTKETDPSSPTEKTKETDPSSPTEKTKPTEKTVGSQEAEGTSKERGGTLNSIFSPKQKKQLKQFISSLLQKKNSLISKAVNYVLGDDKNSLLEPNGVAEDILSLTPEEMMKVSEKAKKAESVLKLDDVEVKSMFSKEDKGEKETKSKEVEISQPQTASSEEETVTVDQLSQALRNTDIGKIMTRKQIRQLSNALKGKKIV